MEGYRPLAASPQPRDPEEEERSPTWSELYFDLFFVAAISNLSHLFDKHPDGPNAGRIVLYHDLIFFLWAEYVMLKTRFNLRGLLFRCVGLGLQLSVLGVIIGARADEKWYRLLAGGYAAARLCISCTHTIIAYTIPHARRLSVVNAAAGLALAVAPAVMALLEQDEEAYVSHVKVIAATAVGAAVLPVLPSLFPATGGMPVHASRINERLGQLVMLHLGEAVIGFAASQLQSTVQQFVGVGLAASLVWALHLLYYLVEPDEKSHAYRQSRARGLLFFYGHWLLCLALLLTGSGLRLLLGMYKAPHHAHHEEPAAHRDTTLMLCTSYAAALHLLGLARAAHYWSLNAQHGTVRAVERAGVRGWWLGWWAMIVLWPLPVYGLPLLVEWLNNGRKFNNASGWWRLVAGQQFVAVVGAGGEDAHPFGVSLLLWALAAHATTLVCCESLFAHMLTKTPVLEALGGTGGDSDNQEASPAPQGPDSGGV